MVKTAVRASHWDEIYAFLVTSPTPQQIIQFEPSAEMAARVVYLLDRNRSDLLTAEEGQELDELLRINHFVSMLKIRAHEKEASA